MPEPNTGCWLYVGIWDSANGYGKISWNGRHMMLHRVVYELIVGPIPDGRVLDHKCRVRACCNPDHLEPVTVRENTLRGAAVLFPKNKSCNFSHDHIENREDMTDNFNSYGSTQQARKRVQGFVIMMRIAYP